MTICGCHVRASGASLLLLVSALSAPFACGGQITDVDPNVVGVVYGVATRDGELVKDGSVEVAFAIEETCRPPDESFFLAQDDINEEGSFRVVVKDLGAGPVTACLTIRGVAEDLERPDTAVVSDRFLTLVTETPGVEPDSVEVQLRF